MADIERGLKEAIAEAQFAKGRDSRLVGSRFSEPERAALQSRLPSGTEPSRPAIAAAASGLEIGRERPAAATVFAMIDAIGGRVREIEERAAELATLLAGSGGEAEKSAGPRTVSSSLFDRFGAELVILGQAIDRIDRDILRALETLR
jgi:hypothetical protein